MNSEDIDLDKLRSKQIRTTRGGETMAITVTCAYCSGSGEHPRKYVPCPVCMGRGKLLLSYDNPVKCRYCSGSGEHPQKYEICPTCKGAGVVPPVLHG